MKAAKGTVLAGVHPAFQDASRDRTGLEVGWRSLLISTHLKLSLNIHDLRLLHSACYITVLLLQPRMSQSDE